MTDTEKWKKPFMKSLPAEYKLFWLYLIDDCDHAAIWHIDIEVAELRLGCKLNIDKARGFFKGRIVEFDNSTKWFIPDFLLFQYGELKDSNNTHKSVLKQLKKYNLEKFIVVVSAPHGGALDKDKDIDKDLSKEAVIEKKREVFKQMITPYVKEYSKELLNSFFSYWSEADKDLVRLRWEMEKTWETSKRLARWLHNNPKFGKTVTEQEDPTAKKIQETLKKQTGAQ